MSTVPAIVIADTPDGRQPRLGASGPPIAAIVHACHDRTIDAGLTALAIPELTRETLEPVLTYCAELRCEADNATCPGCKRRTQAAGIKTLEDFIRGHKEIIVGDGHVRLSGKGEQVLRTPALEALEKTWSGENYWFWARRVLRKLRHGIRRAHIQGEAFAAAGETPAILLMEPQLPDNIGMVARACANFGLDELRLIKPRDGWPNEKALVAAAGADFIIDAAPAFPTLTESIGDLNYVVATTARQRDLTKPVLTPEQAVTEIARRMGEGQRCGVLFGPERTGLDGDEVAVADAIVMAPVNPRFASLNLAQAALLFGYEWMKASQRGTLGRVTTFEQPLETGLRTRGSEPATKEELLGFIAHLKGELERLGFFNENHKRQAVMRNIHSMFARMDATEQEVRTLRGIVATLAKGKGPARKPST